MKAYLLGVWNRIPEKLRTWIKGLEVAIVTGVISGLVTLPTADFSTKAGIAKFAATIATVAGGCLRLYLIQSPIQNVLLQVKTTDTLSTPTGTAEVVKETTVSQ